MTEPKRKIEIGDKLKYFSFEEIHTVTRFSKSGKYAVTNLGTNLVANGYRQNGTWKYRVLHESISLELVETDKKTT